MKPDLISTALYLTWSASILKSLCAQYSRVRDVQAGARGYDRIDFRRGVSIRSVVDNRSIRRAANRHTLRLWIETSVWTKGRHRNLVRKGKIYDRGWSACICHRPITQLSIGICPETPERPVVLYGNAVSASAYRSHSNKIGHRYRCVPVRVGPIPKLTIIIVAPRHHCSIALDSQRMILPCGNCNGVDHPDRLDRHIATSSRAIAKLPIIIKTPVPYCSVSLQRNRM